MYLYNNTEQYETIPERIRLPDGSTRTSLHEYTSDQLEALGLIHYTESTPEYNSFTHYTTSNCTFNHESRTFIREIVPYDESTIKQQLVNAIQVYLDNEAQAHYYDGILSLCSYATSTNLKFGPEGLAGVAWRDACWALGYAVLAECEAGTRTIPTVDELLAEMPVMEWP